MQQLAGPIDRRHLAARAEPGVDAEHVTIANRRLQQQIPEVRREDLDAVIVSIIGQAGLNLAFHRRLEQALITILDSRPESVRPIGSWEPSRTG